MNNSLDTAYRFLEYAVTSAFFLLGLIALGDWLQHRRRSRLWLSLALASLGLVGLGALLLRLTNTTNPIWPTLLLVAVLASGACLVQFRNAVVKYHMVTRILYAVLIAGSVVGLVVIGMPSAGECLSTIHLTSHQFVQYGAVVAALVVWMICIVEPPITLWRVSKKLPAVQRGRLRSLASGYGILATVIVLAVFASSSCEATPAQFAVEACALAVVPYLYAAFSPPIALRRRWRRSEEEQLRQAMHDLLLFSPTREVLAHRALPWAIRLVGGEAGLVVGGLGNILAKSHIDEETISDLVRDRNRLREPGTIPTTENRQAVVRPLNLSTGTGTLIVISGLLSPQFEEEESDVLASYAVSLTIALDRVALFERMSLKEKELQEAKDFAQSANQAKSDFLSRMSHELRTPLTAMMGFAELMDLEDLTERQHEYTQTMLRAGSHLLELINDILDISRIEEGRMSLVPAPLSVKETVHEAIELVMLSTPSRDVRVFDEIKEDVIIMADHQRFRQVLVNFLSNGIKYNKRGGTVIVRVLTEGKDESNNARVVVTDTGVGMSDEDLRHIFNPFERLWAQRSGIEGTGLGLALSKTLAEAMQGSIGVTSMLGQGSSFWVELPIADEELVEAVISQVSIDDGVAIAEGAQTVLYVEDTQSNIRLIEGIFRRRPRVRLIVAPDGTHGIEMAKREQPDLVLLDLHLPDVDGDVVMTQMREDPHLAAVPIIIVSADGTSRQRQRLMDLGAQDYVTKPIDIKRFLKIIDGYLNKEAVKN